MVDMGAYKPQYERVLGRDPMLSNIKPSDWAEANVMIPGKGRLDYDFNQYCREIIDTLAPDHPARKVAVMKGSQITFSSGVIMPALGWTIAEDPGNTILMVGTSDLIKPASEKLDLMIHGAKLQHYLQHQVQRKRNTKTGDTDEIKSFANGYIKIASNSNPKSIAQIDLVKIFLDDFDAMQGRSKVAGSLTDLIEMRAASNKNSYKLMMISTPLEKSTSNIEPAYEMGDQRKYMVECPCCGERIIFKWKVSEGDMINKLTEQVAACDGGIVYELNELGQVDKDTVGYVCYLCGGFFTDRDKQRMLREGVWVPTAVPVSEDYYSYHISSLYAPVGMFDWLYYARKHAEANPKNGPVDEEKMQVLTNTCWGETYVRSAAKPDAKKLMHNIRGYDVGVVPDRMSVRDGNGRIVMLTLAADLNGVVKDARVDWEVRAWSVSGSSYSIDQGSIGTFVPMEGKLKDVAPRKKWTYEHGKANSVWPELTKIIDRIYPNDWGGERAITLAGIDCGHYSKYAYEYLDSTPEYVIGLRGNKPDEAQQEGRDVKWYKPGMERNDYWLLDVNRIKDRAAEYMGMTWKEGVDDYQGAGFMNFPTPRDGKYSYASFFEHYEAEQPVLVANSTGTGVKKVWQKVNSIAQNHFWDCFIYNLGMRELHVFMEVQKANKVTKGGRIELMPWREYAEAIAQYLPEIPKG